LQRAAGGSAEQSVGADHDQRQPGASLHRKGNGDRFPRPQERSRPREHSSSDSVHGRARNS
jgi:hypothetical protein